MRQRLTELADAGFALDSSVDMRADPGLGRDYEASVIAHKFYEAGAVPNDDALRADLDALLKAYNRYIETRGQETDVLGRLVVVWRKEHGYPASSDDTHVANRIEMAELLTAERIDAVIKDPSRYPELEFGRVAARGYGNPGSQSRVHQGVQKGDENIRRLARAIRHVLYDDGEVSQRIDDVLHDGQWKAYGFGESLATKCLAIVYAEQWLPLYQYSGERGKKRLMQSPELALEPLTNLR